MRDREAQAERTLARSIITASKGGEPSRDELVGVAAVVVDLEAGDAARVLIGAISRAALEVNTVRIVATGLGWLGTGIRSVEASLVELIGGASNEIALTAYSITAGADPVLQALLEAASTGIRCTIIVDESCAAIPLVDDFLRRSIERWPSSFRAWRFLSSGMGGLHAKVVVADRRIALVGSANLTYSGMVRSHELALIVQGPAAATIADRIDALAASELVAPVG